MKYNAEELVTFIVETVHMSPVYKCVEVLLEIGQEVHFYLLVLFQEIFLVIYVIYLLWNI